MIVTLLQLRQRFTVHASMELKKNGAFFPVAILTALVRRETIPRNVFTAGAFAGLSEISY